MVLGQIISADYLDRVAEEINDRLQLEGTISIAVLTKEYNLPADFLFEQITSRLVLQIFNTRFYMILILMALYLHLTPDCR